MIKGNQKLLNLFRILIDTAIIVFSFIRAYYLRFSNDSILIRWKWIEEPVGIYGSLKDYMQILIMLIPCYLVSYYFFHLYDPKRTKSRKSEIFNILKSNVVGILYCVAFLFFIRNGTYARLFIIIFVILFLLYKIIPDQNVDFLDTIKGTVVATLLIEVIIGILSIYFSIVDYSNVYGPLAALVMLMFSIAVCSEAIYFGMYVIFECHIRRLIKKL